MIIGRSSIVRFVMTAAILFGLFSPEGYANELSGVANEWVPPSYVTAKDIDGRFTVAGSNTMFPLMTRLAAQFRLYYPAAHIGVEGQGSKSVSTDADTGQGPFWEMIQNKSVYRRGDGSDFGHHVSMQVQVMASSRKLSEKERVTFVSRFGYEPMEVPIALEAVAIYVHRDNPIPGLTLDQVRNLFSSQDSVGRQASLSVWGELGLQDGWRDASVHLYGRDVRSGTRAFFQEHVLGNAPFRDTLKEAVGSASLILAVGQDPQAIGYSGIGYQSSVVRVVPLAPSKTDAYVAPSFETTTDGTYPLTRMLYLYINHKPSDVLSPTLAEFLRFVNSREGQEIVMRSGVYRLPQREIERNLSRLSGERVAYRKDH